MRHLNAEEQIAAGARVAHLHRIWRRVELLERVLAARVVPSTRSTRRRRPRVDWLSSQDEVVGGGLLRAWN